MRPEKLWWYSCRLHRRGFTPVARLLKAVNYFFYKAVLPYEAHIEPDVILAHHGLGTVIHPNCTIGRGVWIGHAVTLAAGSNDADSALRLVIEDDVHLGTGCYIAARSGGTLTVGMGAHIGAKAVVTRDVPAGARMAGPKATQLPLEADNTVGTG